MATAGKTFQFKLVLLGDTSVGKSSIVIRFVKNQFSEFQESTIGGSSHLFLSDFSLPVSLGPSRAVSHARRKRETKRNETCEC